MLKTVKIHSYEKGLYFRDGEFRGLLGTARHWFVSLPGKVRVDVVSQRAPWLCHEKLDMIVRSGALEGLATVLDIEDHQRALVWIDGRFATVLRAGLYAIWTGQRKIHTEIVDARTVRFRHKELAAIVAKETSAEALEIVTVEEDHVGVLYEDGVFTETLPAGRHAFWKSSRKVRVFQVDMRERVLDVAGQDIMTADKVTLRLNAVVTFRVADAPLTVAATEDVKQALYREAQLALRAIVGAKELDTLLADKDAVARELEATVKERAAQFGLRIVSLGVRDIILPGEMKELMNKVTEAKKAAEANLIARREETAAMRSQANTARLLADSPVLMRLRELEVLEKVAGNSKLNVVLGEKGLADRVVNLL
ncbi:MAG TPA: slipin family protein [Phycisphaerae bacterium]|nr:slipin family protein [Phycisphaerae bacterium]HOI53822.1 slipin family protein [Phycisphaerae bacterium]